MILSGHESGCNPRLISIDRIDSNKGYTVDNTVLCCYAVNLMKSDLSVDEMLWWCKAVLAQNPIK